MKIQVTRDGMSGKLLIPKGDYMVSLQAETGTINLVGGGKDFRLPAIRRRTTSKSKITNVSFYSGGGSVWSLVINTPKQGEWIAYIDYAGAG